VRRNDHLADQPGGHVFGNTRIATRTVDREWAAYVVASLGGGCINYVVFAAAVRLSPLLHQIPSIAVGIGTIAGMVFNFVMYATYVFPARAERDPAADRQPGREI
jgi:putative flippase GtrA